MCVTMNTILPRQTDEISSIIPRAVPLSRLSVSYQKRRIHHKRERTVPTIRRSLYAEQGLKEPFLVFTFQAYCCFTYIYIHSIHYVSTFVNI